MTVVIFSVMFIPFASADIVSISDKPVITDAIIDGNYAKKIIYPTLKEAYDPQSIILLNDIIGKSSVSLKLKKTRQVTRDYPYDCNCHNVDLQNETVFRCDTCHNYVLENEIYYEDLKDISQIDNKSEIYEIFEGCQKYSLFPDGNIGCQVWTDISIFGKNVIGATLFGITYPFRQEILINSSAVLTDYQVMLNITESNNGSNWNWTSACDYHFRVEDLSGNNIQYTNESCDSSAKILTMWFKTNITTANGTQAYLLYGNETPSAGNNPESTFDFWDDFETGSLNTTKWKIISGSPTFNNTEGSIILIGDNIVTNGSAFAFDHAMDTRMRKKLGSIVSASMGMNDNTVVVPNTTGDYSRFYTDGTQSLKHLSVNQPSSLLHTTSPDDAFPTKMNIFSLFWTNSIQRVFYNYILNDTITGSAVPDEAVMYHYLSEWNNQEFAVDWTRIRKQIDDQPKIGLGEESTFIGKTSVSHAVFPIDDFIFDSASYVQIGNFTVNVTTPSNFTFKGSMNIKKQSGTATTPVSMRVFVNGIEQFDQPIRTVQGTADIGVATIPFFLAELNQSTNEIIIEVKETGGGSVNISNFVLHADSEFSSNGNVIENDINNIVDFSYVNSGSQNFNVIKTINSTTLFDISHTATPSGSGEFTCYLENQQSSPGWSRWFSSGTDIGSSGMNCFDDTSITGITQYTIKCTGSPGRTFFNNISTYWFSLEDSASANIEAFQENNISSILYPEGTSRIISKTGYEAVNGDSIELLFTASASSDSLGQTPTFILNSTNASLLNCSSSFPRRFTSANDVGTIKFYTDCNNLTVGEFYNFDVFVSIPNNRDLQVWNVSLTGYETESLNVTASNIPPIPNSIVNPENNSIVFGENENVTWIAFTDPATVTYNISLFFINGSFAFSINPSTTSLTTPANWSAYPFDNYDLVVEGCDPFNLCSNTTHNITSIAIPTCNVTFNIRDADTNNNLDQIIINCGISYSAVNKTSPFDNEFIFGSYTCNITKSNYNPSTKSFSCIGVDFDVNVTLSQVVPTIELNITLTLDLADLKLTDSFCINEDTLRNIYKTEVRTEAGAENVTRSELKNCPYGCDLVNRKCRASPIELAINFMLFTIAIGITILLPLFIITKRMRRKTLKAVVDMITFFITLLIYIVMVSFMLIPTVSLFGEEYATLSISIIYILILNILIMIGLLARNVMKNRYT